MDRHGDRLKTLMLQCNEKLFTVDGDVDDFDKHHPPTNKFCKACVDANSFNLKAPIRLAHLAAIKCFTICHPVSHEKLSSVWFSNLKVSILGTKSRNLLARMGCNEYSTCGRIMELLVELRDSGSADNYRLIGRRIGNVVPYCCCGAFKNCRGNDVALCRNFRNQIWHQYEFEKLSGHIVDGTVMCCCDGYYTQSCLNLVYVDLSLILHSFCWFSDGF